MADNLSIAVTADTTSLRAQLALAQADLRSFSTELRNTANAARQAGGATDPKLAAAAGQYATAAGQVSKLKSELNELAGVGKKTGESMTEGFRLFPGVMLRVREQLGGLKEAAEAVGAAFAVEKVVDWSLEAAEAGERAVNMAAAIGTSTERYSELSQAMQLAGGDAQTASRAFQLLAQHAEDALQNPMAKASQAFAQLGVSTAQLEEGLKDPTTLIDRIAEGFQKLEAAGRGGEAITALRALAGRGNFALVAAIREGADGLARLKQEARDSGAVVGNELGGQMTETMEKVHQLGLAFQGLKNSIYEGLRDPLNESLDILTAFLEQTTHPATNPFIGGGGSTAHSLPGSDWWRGISPDALNGQGGAAGSSGMRPGGALDLIERYESGGRNIPNFRYDKTHTASGNFMITDTNWRAYGPGLGINTSLYPTAMSAPYGMQRGVAGRMYGQSGFKPWADFNPALKAAIGGGQGGGGGGSPERSFEDMQKSLEAMWTQQREVAQRAMSEAQRKLGSGDTSAQGSYNQAAQQYRSVTEAQAKFGEMANDPSRRDELIEFVTKNAPKASAAYFRAGSEMNALDAEMAKSREELAQRSVEAVEKAASAMRKVNADWLKEYQTGITAQVKSGDLTARQGYGYDIQAVRSVSGKDIAGLSSVANMPGATPDQVTGAQAQIGELKAAANVAVAEFNEKIVADAKATAEAWAAPFKKAIDGIGSTLESGISGILEHKETGRKFAMSLRDSAISSGVNMVGTGLSKGAAAPLAGVLGVNAKEGAGVGDVLGDKLGSLIQSGMTKMIPSLATKGVDTISQATTMATSVTTPLVTALTGLGTSIVAAIQLSAGEIVGAVTVNTANPEILGNKFSGGGIVPRFAFGGIVHRAAGGWHVPSSFGTDTVPAMLTPGEHVLPTNLAKAYQAGADALNGGGGARGDVHVHNQFGAFADAPAVSRGMRTTINQLRAEARAAIPT